MMSGREKNGTEQGLLERDLSLPTPAGEMSGRLAGSPCQVNARTSYVFNPHAGDHSDLMSLF